MSLTDRALALVGLQKSAPVGPSTPSGIPAAWPSNFFQYGYNKPRNGGTSVVEACVSAYAQTIAQLPGRHYQLDDNGTKSYVTGSKLARVLAKPNDFQTRSDFLLNMTYSLLLNGNSYWVGDRVGNDRASEIFLLDPSVTQAHRVQGTGEVYYSTSGEFVEIAGSNFHGKTMIPERYVGHLRLHTPTDPLVGVTPLTNAAASVAAHEAIVTQQASFFSNASRPSGLLTTDMDLTKDQMVTLREAWNEHSKSLNAGGVPILGNGMKWNPMSITSQDAQLVESWKMTVEDISRVFRVPPMLINNMENATFQNAETLMRYWLASGLGFLINHIELAMAAYYGLDNRKEGVELDQEVLLRSDLKGQMDALGTGVTKGLLSPNEGRAKIGYGPVDGGDMPRVQAQMIPLDAEAAAPEPATPAEPVGEPAVPDDDDEKNTVTIVGLDDPYVRLSTMADKHIEEGLMKNAA